MATKYRTTGDWKIEKVEVLRETEKSVFLESRFYGERRENKFSDFHCYFDTFEDAKSHILSIAESKVKNAESKLQRAKDNLKKVIEYKESENGY